MPSPPTPRSANTPPVQEALVLEHLCLFTHDLRRKQKRWQDGKLKYHTFNRRIMVYDERGNFIGDTHWRSDCDLDVGDELQLDRGSVIVQVSDCVGQRVQDLSELLNKRPREKCQAIQGSAATFEQRPPTATHPSARPPSSTDHFLLKHRPLKDLISTPIGHDSRVATSRISPFQQRLTVATIPPNAREERPAKRQKPDGASRGKLGYAQCLFGAPLNLTGGSTVTSLSHTVRGETVRKSHLPETSSGIGLSTQLTPSSAGNKAASEYSRQPLPNNHATQISPVPRVEDTPPSHRPVTQNEATTASVGKRRPSKAENTIGGPRAVFLGPSNLHSSECEVEITTTEKISEVANGASGSPVRPVDTSSVAKLVGIGSAAAGGRRKDTNSVQGVEPKTELRLKSRQKRGLLCVSEERASASWRDISPQLAVCDRSVDEQWPTATSEQSQPQPRDPAPTTSAQGNTYHQPGGGTHTALDISNSGRDAMRGQEKVLARAVDRLADGQGKNTEPRSMHGNKAILEQQASLSGITDNPQEVESIERDQAAMPAPSCNLVGPARLVRLRRKCVKSREVIGFPTGNLSKTDTNDGISPVSAAAQTKGSPSADESTKTKADKHAASRGRSQQHPSTNTAFTSNTYHPPAQIFQDRRSDLNETSAKSRDPGREPRQYLQTLPDSLYNAPRAHAPVPGAEHKSQHQAHLLQHSEQAQQQSHIGGVADPSCARKTPSTSRDESTPTRLTNPATRGRKAALKSDAVGRAPQSLLPLESPADLYTSLESTRAAAQDAEKKEPQRKMRFPGFVSAKGGGPWSREAHDLLTTSRPV